MNSSEVLQDWFGRFRGTEVDLELAGKIFGGRSGESPQRVSDFSFDREQLEISFAGAGEQLIAVKPSSIALGYSGNVRTQDVLIIPDALEVQFGWHYYGRPPLPENWCTRTYRFEGDWVTRTSSGPIGRYAPNQSFRRTGAPAVRLVPLSTGLMDRR